MIANGANPDAIVYRVPAELWREIFLHTASRITFDPYSYHHARTIPFTLSAVCSPWREIALSTAELWNRFAIHFSWCDVRNKYPVSEIGLCLERSKQAPLSIGLIASEQVHRGIMQSLIRNSDRWQELRLTIEGRRSSEYRWPGIARTSTSALEKDDLLQLLGTVPHLPALESLSYHYSKPGVPYLLADLPMFHDAPELRSLVIHSVFNIATKTPWSQLTSFICSGYDIPFANVVQVLQLCVNLESLHIVAGHSIDEELNDPILPLNKLTCLTLEIVNDWIAVPFFQKMRCMRLPALATLNLSCPSKRSWTEAFKNVLVCIGCSLSLARLDIRGSLRDGKLNEILSLLPNLKELSVNVMDWGRDDCGVGIAFGRLVMQGLRRDLDTDSDSLPLLVPNLACLQLVTDDENFLYSEFVDMVASRWSLGGKRGIARLETVKLLTRSFLDKDTDVYRWLQNMKEEGLYLIIEEENGLYFDDDQDDYRWQSVDGDEDEEDEEDENAD